MTKRELIAAVAESHDDLAKSKVRAIVEAMFDAMGETLRTEGRYTHPGFGTFTVRSQSARLGRNPHTGEPIALPATRTVGFKPAAELKKTVESAEGR
jgi:nucleoid DNA-binding protein